MENGYIILGIVALLFLSMYGYAYASVILEKIREKKIENIEHKKEELKAEQMTLNQKVREEKMNQLNKRSQEIKLELERLEQMKKERESKKLKIS